MGFSLQFVDRRRRMAHIRAGTLSERFGVDLDVPISSLEGEWRRELARLLGKRKRVMLRVSGHRKTVSRAWILYRVGRFVFVQDRLFPGVFRLNKSRIPRREAWTDKGAKISEWCVLISAVESFLNSESISSLGFASQSKS